MEKFRNLDWHPALEDMIDNVFVRDERMEHESAMYRIMCDSFKNPFEDILNDYADINIKQIKKYLREDDEEVSPDSEDENSYMKNERRSYVPGIRKVPFNYPRVSRLNKAQQAICLNVLLRLSNNEKIINEKQRKEFQEYMALQEIISEEQNDFLQFVEQKWNDSRQWLIKCNKFAIIKWQTKMKRFTKLPRYYVESTNIPLVIQKIENLKNKEIKLTFTSCLRQSFLPEVILPKLDKQCVLFMDPNTLLERYPPCISPDKVIQHFKLPVSEDTYCESLAVEAKADFVISSSGLKCLLSNVDPNYPKPWLIPVIVKSNHEKNIVYVNKRLPPAKATVSEKNTWVYKYILRHYFVKSELLDKAKHMKEDKLEEAANYSDTESDLCNDHLKIYEEDLYLSEEEGPEKSDDLASGKTDSKINEQQNVLYNLFTLGPVASSDHDQIKHNIKEYKMLVRTKTDGKEVLPNDNSKSLILAPKMEHQLAMGAEAITLEEGLHQWISLKFRPKTSLARVRITTDTAEVIQIERHTSMSLSIEIKRLYNVKVDDSLSILHNIIEVLSSLTPGQYIMRYIPQNGPFAYVYKQVDYRENAFDLHTICQSGMFETLPKTPWPPIDKMITTPAIRCFQKMPAMFNPNNYTKNATYAKKFASGRPRGRPKKNASDTNPEKNASDTNPEKNTSVTNSKKNASVTNNQVSEPLQWSKKWLRSGLQKKNTSETENTA